MWEVKANEQEPTFMSKTEDVSELFLQTGEILHHTESRAG